METATENYGKHAIQDPLYQIPSLITLTHQMFKQNIPA